MTLTIKRYEQQAQYLANYLPTGKFWNAKYIKESNLRKLLNAFGKEYVNIEDSLEWLRRETNILTTYDLIEFWEKAYGIPDKDGVFTIENKNIDDRRFNLYIKELMDGADQAEDWENIASKFGFKCKVYPASKTTHFTYKFPIRFYDKSKYTILVEFSGIKPPSVFPLIFPVAFGNTNIVQLQKIFNIIKPADCTVTYLYSNIPTKDAMADDNEQEKEI